MPFRLSAFPRSVALSLFALPLLGTVSVLPGAQAAETAAVSAPLPHLTWHDVQGHAYTSADFAARKATVFVFVSSQCPIANTYTPRLVELGKTYRAQGVNFFLVDSNREDSAAKVQQYARERAFPFPAVKDNGTALVDSLGADKTPEAIIVDAQGIVRYRGRIDDNADRSKVTRSDVREALDALLAGKPIGRTRTLAFGCSIFRDTVAPAAVTGAATFTYARDIAPILNRNCVSCHRAGEAAPFPLQTYAQAKTWATAIKEYTARHLMPPWKPIPGYGEFCDARTLTPKEIAAIARWADSGAPQGHAAKAVAVPTFAPASEWALGKPDMELKPVAPYHLAAEGKDVYREFVLPAQFAEDRYLNGIELKAGNRAIVHHIIVFFDPSGKSAELDGKETEPGYSVPGGAIGVKDAVWVVGWAPGNSPNFLSPGTAFKLPANGRIVLQVHYHKTGKVEEDRSRIGLHFVDKAQVDQVLYTAPVAGGNLALKPNVAHQEVTGSFTLPTALTIRAALPHMHMLGHEMKVTATLPDGKTVPMIYINDWDFNWQETYRYKAPLHLPAGTKVNLVAYFDNTEQNPRQPSHPPRFVTWGEQTTDEMCLAFFQFTVDAEHLQKQPVKSAALR